MSVMTKVLSVVGLLVVANVAAAVEYEAPRDRSAKAILEAAALKGQYYRIQDVVPTDGYTDRWTVKSDFGDFDVAGDGALRKLLGEINAIAELKKISKTKEFVKGLGGAAKAPLSFVKSLATHPVNTVTGIPKGAYAIVENAGTAVTSSRDPSQDSRAAELLKMSSFKRELATRLCVDVYSSNNVLQKEMNGVAWAATAGDWAFSAAMLPAGVGGGVAGRDAFLTLAIGAQDEAEANLYTAMVPMLRGYHETASPLIQIVPLNRLTVTQTKTRAALVAAPLDQLIWTERVDRVTGQLKSDYKPAGFNAGHDPTVGDGVAQGPQD